MPSALIYLGIMLVCICVWFLLLKRPIYEAVLVSFITLLTVTNKWANLYGYITEGLSTNLIYSMVAFVAMSQVLTHTKIVDSCVLIILSVLGRIRGGAGYVAVFTSSFMGALSGSGPGNVMATGVITIPAMKKSGFPPELAGNIESVSSCMGNMIPPSANIVAAMGAYLALYPESELHTGTFWVILWGIALWFILSRLIGVYAFCRHYKVKPTKKEDLPSFKQTFKDGWQALLLPVVILLPFVLDSLLSKSYFEAQLGHEGANMLSSSLLITVAGFATLYAMLITKDKKSVSLSALAKTFSEGCKSLSSVVATCMFGYMIGALFADLHVADDMLHFIEGLSFGKVGMCLFIPFLTCFLGMIIPGSSQVVMFGPVFISSFAAVGVNPLLAAAMLPCICGTMSGFTPPLALGMYAGMSLSGADFSKTVKNDLWWVALQYILEVVILLGWLPILGL